MTLSLAELLYLIAWALLGSILGFFAFSYTPSKPPHANICRGVLSVCIGVFIALFICTYLEEFHKFSKHFNIIASGLGAFGLPDFLMKWWPRFVRMIVGGIIGKLLGPNIRYPDDSKDDNKDEGIG